MTDAVLSSRFFSHSKPNINLNLENKFYLQIVALPMRNEMNKKFFRSRRWETIQSRKEASTT